MARLAAVAVTHEQRDHSGGLEALLARVPADRLLHADAPASRRIARRAGTRPVRVLRGDEVGAGGLRLRVLWPPPGPAATGQDPNHRSLVLLASWRGFDALLTGDAEADVAPVDPGPIELLKVAHHGSADPSLAGLLARTRPAVAAISAGRGNRFGHPAPATLRALAASGARVVRTDRGGTIRVEVGRDGWMVRP